METSNTPCAPQLNGFGIAVDKLSNHLSHNRIMKNGALHKKALTPHCSVPICALQQDERPRAPSEVTMADSTNETASSAEKAYAEAAGDVKSVEKAAAPAPEPAKPVVAKQTAEPKKPATPSRKIKKPAPSKPAA